MDLNPTFICAKKAHSKTITQVAFSEKGNQLASCSSDASIKVLSLSSLSPSPLPSLPSLPSPPSQPLEFNIYLSSLQYINKC
jgi:WD40 repeat protein